MRIEDDLPASYKGFDTGLVNNHSLQNNHNQNVSAILIGYLIIFLFY